MVAGCALGAIPIFSFIAVRGRFSALPTVEFSAFRARARIAIQYKSVLALHTVTSEVFAIKAVFATRFTGISCDKFIRLAGKSKAVAKFILAVAFSANTRALIVIPNIVRVRAS